MSIKIEQKFFLFFIVISLKYIQKFKRMINSQKKKKYINIKIKKLKIIF